MIFKHVIYELEIETWLQHVYNQGSEGVLQGGGRLVSTSKSTGVCSQCGRQEARTSTSVTLGDHFCSVTGFCGLCISPGCNMQRPLWVMGTAFAPLCVRAAPCTACAAPLLFEMRLPLAFPPVNVMENNLLL